MCNHFKLIALLCLFGTASISDSATAQSSITLYGHVDGFVGEVKNPGSRAAVVMQGGGMSTSYWGVRGTEDLGDAYSAFFVLESYLQLNNGMSGRFSNDRFFSRNAYLGINGPYGSIRAGRLTTPLYLSTINQNPFFNSYLFSPWIFHTYKGLGPQGVVGDSGWDNAVAYTSPNLRGFSSQLIYSFGNSADQQSSKKWGAQLAYANGPLQTTFNYQWINYSNLAGDIAKALPAIPGLQSEATLQAAGSYNFNLFRLFVGYMNIRDDAMNGVTITNTEHAGVSIPLQTASILAALAYSKSTGLFSTDARRFTWSVGYDSPISKRTDAYVAFKFDKYGQLSAGLTYGVGLRHQF